jgi:anaerobic magnesium-protoporphyrin IX monomethyl ester cyclase
MSNVVFVQNSGINESLALTELSAALRLAGHGTRLFLADEERHLSSELQAIQAQIAIIPCHVAGHEEALSYAAMIKEVAPNCLVVLAGTHATFDPELALENAVDAVCIGEADQALVELCNAVASGKDWRSGPNLAFDDHGLQQTEKRPLIADLDDLPMPHRDLYFRYGFMARFPWKKFSTGRGCVHACSFCWNPSVAQMYTGKTPFTRRKSPERAVEEVLWVKQNHPLKTVHFSDDLFTFQPQWLEAFAEDYARRVGVPFTCNSSVELVSERNVAALKAAGCRGVAIGIETGNEILRSAILNKTVSNDDVRIAAARIKGAGMELTTFNMLASPGESLADAFSTIALNQEIGADHVRIALAVPIPFTEWENKAKQEGLLQADYTKNRIASLRRPQPAFATENDQAFENLYYLFRMAVHYPRTLGVVRRLIHSRSSKPFDPLRLLNAWEEKKINGIGWVDGLRFFSHVGDPKKRTANYVTLI